MKTPSIITAMFTGVFLLVFSSCGNKELSKKATIKIIKEHYHLPITNDTYVVDDSRLPGYPELLNLGLISVHEERLGMYYNHIHYSVTEKGKEFFKSEEIKKDHNLGGYVTRQYSVLTFVSHSVDIADMSISSNAKQKTAEVLVTMKIYDVTPFGEHLDGYENGMTFQNNLNFQLYDDGWKLVENESCRLFLFFSKEKLKKTGTEP